MNHFNSELLNITAVVTPSCVFSFSWASLLNHSTLLPARGWILNMRNYPCSQISATRLCFDQSLPYFPKDELTS